MCTFQPPMTSCRSVYSSAFMSGALRLFDGRTDEVAPLRPRTVVILDVVAEEILQRKPRMAGALADAAVRDDRFVAGDADAVIQLLQFLDAPEGAVIVREFRPRHVLRARNVSAALAGLRQSWGRQDLTREFRG